MPVNRRKALEPGKIYHIYNRGNNRENVFPERRNYSYFLRLYARHVLPVADTFAYCLMPNHFHLLVRVKQMEDATAPTRAFQALFTAYTQAINKASGRTGRLFSQHFGRLEVETEPYFAKLVHCIHLNPQKHGFVTDFRDWEWSSYAALKRGMPTRLSREHVMGCFGGAGQFEAFHLGSMDANAIGALIEEDLQ